MTVYIIL